MTDPLERRLAAAVGAAWRTLIIAAVWMTVAWLLWLLILRWRPDWLTALWGGGDLDWPAVQTMVLWFFAAFKLLLFAAVMVTIWLALWARRLRRG